MTKKDKKEIIDSLKSKLRLQMDDVTPYAGPTEYSVKLVLDDTVISEIFIGGYPPEY